MASDSDKEEDFVNYGTPLEPLEEDEAPRRPVPLHEQTVLDERGRFQRFHGAFTGGFSAGYFNTVGSKEGWTPSTFVSSRQQKAEKQHHARPEDFMDEEDLGEHGIAPRQITTSQEFSSGRRDAAAEKARAVGAAAALIPGDTLLEELIRPARSSVGVRLLTRMGWREGQGVGPRVKRKRRQQNPPEPESGVRVYGCSAAPAGSEESEDEDEFAPEDATFAPKDVTPVDFTPRTGRQGLGYRGLDPGLALPGFGPGLGPEPGHVDLFRPQSDSRSRLFGGRQGGSRRGGVAGQAFGVGALEDEDEDVYQRDCMSRYDRELGEEEPGDGLFGWTAPKQYRRTEGSRDASYLGKILEGFTLAQRPPEEKTVFPPPRLPRDYRPVYRGVQVSRLEGVSPALAQALKASKGHMEEQGPPQGRHQLGSGQRGALLGEDTLTGPSSVMELLRPEDRQRLLRLRSSSSQQPPPVAPPVPDLQQEALAAWRGASSSSSSSFKPFEKNPEKQQRYDLYLNRLRQGDAGALDQSLDPTMTEWERSREREEFARASILYRPSSSSLTSRFTRAKQEDEDPPEVRQDQEKVDGEAPQAAASMKLFGKLTRETLEWHPDRLLCRRFNVPDPFPGSSLVGLPKIRRDKFSIFNFLTVTDSRQEAAPPPPDSGKKSRWDVSEQMKKSKTGPDQASAEQDLASSEPDRASSEPDRASADPAQKEEPRGPEEEQQEEQEEESRPPMDLFKAIFASSSEEKSSSSEEEGEASDAEVKEEEMEEEVSLFTSPPAAPPPSCPAPPAPAASSHRQQVEQQEEFGPKLPPPNSRGGAATQEVKPSRRSKEKKHKKEKKKKKKKKHKQRHKQQKKSRREESSSSQEEEQEQEEEEPAGGAVSTEELLRRLKSLRSGPVQ